jgi:hypothetical protein
LTIAKKKIPMAIIDQLQPIGLLYKEGRHEDCLHQLHLLWNHCPTPREEDGNTFLILLYFTKILREMERFEEAMEWALKAILYNGTRNLAGEGEMLIGQCAFAAGKMELARDMFCIARSKGGKRIFSDEPQEYFELTNQKSGYQAVRGNRR